jgi:hypothetical protein
MTVAALAGWVESEQDRGAFAENAFELREHGLFPIPIGRENDKTPLIRGWNRWKHLVGEKMLGTWIQQFPDANIGIACRLSGITIIDIDDRSIVDDMIQQFGDTPLITSTPSGGVHLWFKSSGERNANLRSHGLDVDVRGVGGLAVVPPSIRRSGDYAGKEYSFLKGNWEVIPSLPSLKPGSLSFEDSCCRQSAISSLGQPVPKGIRDDSLFHYLKKQAPYCDVFKDLADVAQTFNMHCQPPLPDAQVLKTARSVWGYHERGELWTPGGPPRVKLTGGEHGELTKLYANPDALALYCKLQESHAAREKPFAISPRAMHNANVITGFGSERRYRIARKWLLDNELIICVHHGGRGNGDPSLFWLPSKKGA